MSVSPQYLERLLDPVSRALGAEASRQLVGLRADPEMQARVDELADRANEGLLTPEERGEYEAQIATAAIVAILQAKARAVLSGPSAA